jgi:threonine dehydratase
MYDMTKCIERLRPYITKTPLVESEVLSEAAGTKVYLKLESFQKTGAFKFRGAINYLLSLDEKERESGVVTASSGNHGLGMSLGSKILGVRCTVVMPERAPLVKQERAKKYGSEVIVHGETYDDAADYARNLGEKRGCAYVPSFNNPAIMEGQGTILAEILEDLPDTDLVVAPIGGGGLIAGLIIAKDQLKPDIAVIGAEPTGAASMKASLESGKLMTLERLDTIADGVAVKTVGDLTFDVVRRENLSVVEVVDDDIKEAQKTLLTGAKVLSEPAGAVSVAAVIKMASIGKNPLPRKVVCVITGANMDLEDLKNMLT